jgi:predicted DNA-binding protein (MmcQ/YjbR family)
MSPAALRQWATRLPGASIEVKWGADQCLVVSGKMFAVLHESGARTTVSFKVDKHRFLELTDLPGIIPAPYLARAGWVQLCALDVLPAEELKTLLCRSYELVVRGLPKRLQPSPTGLAR